MTKVDVFIDFQDLNRVEQNLTYILTLILILVLNLAFIVYIEALHFQTILQMFINNPHKTFLGKANFSIYRWETKVHKTQVTSLRSHTDKARMLIYHLQEHKFLASCPEQDN